MRRGLGGTGRTEISRPIVLLACLICILIYMLVTARDCPVKNAKRKI